MTGDLSFEKRTQRELAVLLCFGSVRITGLLDMATYLQLIIKITQSDFKAKIKGQMSESITMENKKA